MVNCLTDNKQRTVSDVRSFFNKTGGRLAESGSVGYLFQPKGVIIVEPEVTTEDAVTEAAKGSGLWSLPARTQALHALLDTEVGLFGRN